MEDGYRAGEVALDQPLSVQLHLQRRDEADELVDGESSADHLVLVDDRPAAMLQDQQTDVSAETEDIKQGDVRGVSAETEDIRACPHTCPVCPA